MDSPLPLRSRLVVLDEMLVHRHHRPGPARCDRGTAWHRPSRSLLSEAPIRGDVYLPHCRSVLGPLGTSVLSSQSGSCGALR